MRLEALRRIRHNITEGRLGRRSCALPQLGGCGGGVGVDPRDQLVPQPWLLSGHLDVLGRRLRDLRRRPLALLVVMLKSLLGSMGC